MLSFRLLRIGVSTALFSSALLGSALIAACGDDEVGTASPAPLTPGESAGTAGGAGENGPPPAMGAAGSGAGGAPGAGGSAAPPGGAPGEGTPGEGTPGEGTPPDDDAGPPPPSGPAPDLVLDAAYLIDTTIEDIVVTDDQCLLNEGCVTGLGERRVVRFGTRTGNIGTADFLLGRPEASNPYWTYDACHDTYDLVGFAFYELFDAAGVRVLTGVKNGFCIRDSEPWELEGGPACRSFDCNGQGIGQGCADNYGSELQCQWVDITGLSAGTYRLRVTVNANRNIAEPDYANNVVEVNLEILADSVRVLP